MLLIELPKLYENLDEATIGLWKVQPGDTVRKGDPLAELITDKMVMDLDAPEGGVVLALYAPEKSVIPVGYILCAIGEAGEAAPDVSAENQAKVQARLQEGAFQIPTVSKSSPAVTFQAAPAAKIFARQQGVDLAEVARFCGRSVIHRKDVEDFLAQKVLVATPQPAPAANAAPADRVVLVTGASGAIGAAICEALAEKGFSLAMHYHAHADAAKALAERLTSQYQIKCELFQQNLTEPNAGDALVKAVLAKMRSLDVLINNAGALADAPLPYMNDNQWNTVLSLNLTAPFQLIRAAAMPMARRHFGRIINLCSDAGRMGSATRANYSAAKAGLEGLTRSAARELAALGITVNGVAPGFVDDSPMTAPFTPERRKDLFRQIPQKRFVKPAEVAALVAFLAGNDAAAITGQIISIDGGLFMG